MTAFTFEKIGPLNGQMARPDSPQGEASVEIVSREASEQARDDTGFWRRLMDSLGMAWLRRARPHVVKRPRDAGQGG